MMIGCRSHSRWSKVRCWLIALLLTCVGWSAFAQSNVTLVAPRAKVTANTTFVIRANHTKTDTTIAYRCFADAVQVGPDLDPAVNTNGTVDCTFDGGLPAGDHDVTVAAVYSSDAGEVVATAKVLPIQAV
jgi:hypothetical protein